VVIPELAMNKICHATVGDSRELVLHGFGAKKL
jgi:hypothetical protein